MDETLRVYRLLAAKHAGTGSLTFPLRPKLHVLQEICDFTEQSLLNARFYHTFKDEDAMGFTKRICKRVHKGLLELRTLCRLMLRYRSEEGCKHWADQPARAGLCFGFRVIRVCFPNPKETTQTFTPSA